METLTVNVVIVPDEKTEKKARELGGILADNFESYYTLADRAFIPHATIYQAHYPAENVGKIKDVVGGLSAGYRTLKVAVGPFQNYFGFIWWNVLKNDQLTRLHYKMIKELNPLRKGLLMPHLTPTGFRTGEKFTKEEGKIVKQYGTVAVGEMFQPHITLARLKTGFEEPKLYELLGRVESEFEVSKISIGKMGDHGTVIEILERYSLCHD